MKTLSGKILRTMGWELVGEFPDIKKSITIFAPHTAHIDAFYGKLTFMEFGIKYRFLSKKELFFFPMNMIMKTFGSIAVRGVKGKNAIYQIVDLLNNSEELHIVMSPEGQIARITEWNKGFYYMALKSNVPIVVTYLDYEKKELGVKGVINDLKDYKMVLKQINEMYKDVSGKAPNGFALERTN